MLLNCYRRYVYKAGALDKSGKDAQGRFWLGRDLFLKKADRVTIYRDSALITIETVNGVILKGCAQFPFSPARSATASNKSRLILNPI